MVETFKSFSIHTEKITAIVTDGEAAVKKACSEIIGKDRHLLYIAHVVAHLLPDTLKKRRRIKQNYGKSKINCYFSEKKHTSL